MKDEFMGVQKYAIGEIKQHFLEELLRGQAGSWQPEGEPFLWLKENDKKGGAEVHKQIRDVFVVVSGSPVFIIGGELINPVEKSPGELRAAEIKSGQRVELNSGDVLSVPAGTPHQRFAHGEIFLLVFKIPAE